MNDRQRVEALTEALKSIVCDAEEIRHKTSVADRIIDKAETALEKTALRPTLA